MTALVCNELSLGYDKVLAIRDLSAEIKEGSLTAIVGPNGAGKSTLLRGISGELSPMSGQITRTNARAADIAYLPQQTEIDRSFPITVLDFVAMGFWHSVGPFGAIGRKHTQRLMDAIDAVDLRGFEDRAISALSGGQMQRVLFARLLLQDAKLVLLDEPFTAIDAKTTADLMALVKAWQGEGRTVIAVLHDHDMVRTHFPETLMVARDLVSHGKTADVMTSENLFAARRMCEACDHPPAACDHKIPNAA